MKLRNASLQTDKKSVAQYLPERRGIRFARAAVVALVLLGSMGSGVADVDGAMSEPEFKLGAGEREGYKWDVSAHGESRSRERALCVSVRLTPPRRSGLPGGETGECKSPNAFPIMSMMVIGRGQSQGSVSTFVTSRKVAYVLLGLRDGSQERIRLRPSTEKLQGALGISAFSYLVFGKVGPFCITAITSLSKKREVIDESGTIPCRNQ